MRTWAGSSQEVLKEHIYSWSKPQTDLCPRSAFYPLNPKVQKLFKGWALRSAQIVHGMSWWLTGAVLMPEKSVYLYTGQAAVQAPALPIRTLQFTAPLTAAVWWSMELVILQITAQSKLKVHLPFPTPSLLKKKSYLFILIIPESNICRKLKGKHKNPWWVAGSIFSNSLTAQLIH